MKRAFWSIICSVLAMGLVGYLMYPQLPQRVPSHWNLYGEVDAWQTPLQSVVFIPLLSLVLGFVMAGLSRFDARISVQRAMQHTIITMMVFFFVLHTTILCIGIGVALPLPRIIIVAIGLLFAALGQIMKDVDPNGFIGIRVYWTLTNPTVWRESHKQAATAMAVAAVILVILAFMPVAPIWHFGGLLLVIVLSMVWPMVFAYRRFHQLNDETSPSTHAE